MPVYVYETSLTAHLPVVSYVCQGAVEELSHQETYDLFNTSMPNYIYLAFVCI
jgi:hypothetical protein